MNAHSINNNYLEATFLEKGAELCKLTNLKNGIQYIWDANPDIWSRHSPILFPIVGALKESIYFYNDQRYYLPKHGFARNKIFQIFNKEHDTISFVLKEDDETLKHFPFNFELVVEYKLKGNALEVTFYVNNTNGKKMYFSIGAHPAFHCPLVKNENYKDYYIEFEKDENTNRYFLLNDLQSDMQSKVLENEKIIPLTHNKFKEDALIFKKLVSSKVYLKSGKSKNGVLVQFSEFPYLGIWAKTNADFVCIEPWQGIADHKNSNQKLEEKEGIICLGPEEVFSCQYSISTIY